MANIIDIILSAKDNATATIKAVTGQLEAQKAGLQSIGAASAVAFTGIATLGTFAVKSASQMQDLRQSFDTMLGSAEQGKKLFIDIQKMSTATPFNSADLAKASQTMLGFGIAGDKVLGNMSMLGDIAMGNAGKLQSLALVFGQISSAGRLTGGDLLQLVNVGFNPLEVISKKTGRSMRDLRDDMEKGKISFDMVKEAMRSSTAEGGRFFNGMKNASTTFSGVMSTLQDNISQVLAAIGGFANGEVVKGGLLESLTNGMKKIMPYLSMFSQWAADNPGLAKNILLTVGAITGLVAGLSGFALIAPAIGASISLMLGPVGILLGAISLLATAWINNWGGMQEKVNSAIQFMTPYFQSIVAFFQAEGPSALAYLQAKWGEVWTAIQTTTATLMTTLGPALAQLLTWWTQNGEGIKQSTIDTFKAVIDTSAASLIWLITNVPIYLMAIGQFFYDSYLLITNTYTQIATSIANTWAVIQAGIAVFISWALATFGPFLEQVRIYWATNGEQIMAIATQLWEWYKTYIGASLAVVVAVISQSFDQIKLVIGVAWEVIKGIFIASIQLIIGLVKAQFELMAGTITAIMQVLNGDFKGAWETMKTTFATVGATIVTTGSQIFTTLKDAVINIVNQMIEFVNSKLQSIVQTAQAVANKIGSIAGSIGIGGGGGVAGARAEGGPVQGSSTYLVGERGPELFTPRQSGTIVPNNQLQGGKSGGITINLGGVTVNNEADENRLIEKMKRALVNESKNLAFGIA